MSYIPGNTTITLSLDAITSELAKTTGATFTGPVVLNGANLALGTGSETIAGRSLPADGAVLDAINTGLGLIGRTGDGTFSTLTIDGTNGEISVSNGNGLGGDPKISLSDVGTPGTYTQVTTDSKGRIISGSNPTTLAGYGITDQIVTFDGDGGVSAPIFRAATFDGNAATATKLETPRTINGLTFDGTQNIELTTSSITEGANKYFTESRVRDSISVSGVGLTFNVTTGVITSDATSNNTASTLVARDASGNFTASNITASTFVGALTGNSTTATRLATGRTISVTGDATGVSASFNGSANASIPVTLSNTGITPGAYGSTTQVGTFSVDSKGRLTTAGNATIAFPVTSVAGKTGDVTLAPDDVGLGNVENKSSSTIRGEITSSNVTAALGYTPENAANKNTAGGYAGLDLSGKIASSQLPALAITDTFVVSSQSEMLALVAETGDIAVRTDLAKSFILRGNTPSVAGDWQELLTPPNSVVSVNGRTGSVVLTTSDVGEGSNLYYTDTRARSSLSVNGTGLSYSSTTGVITSNATANNTASTAVARDGSGGFSAGTITATLSGNASSATILQTARTINGVSFNGSANISFTTSNVAEGSNLYYTAARFTSDFATRSTTNLVEGSNLYFTNARARQALSVTGDLQYNSSTGVLSYTGVNSVAGKTGAVTLTSGDVGLANVINSPQVVNAGGTPSIQQGLAAALPTAGTAGRLYLATDASALYRDTGSAWSTVQPAISGDITVSAGGTTAALSNTGVSPGTYNGITVDSKGRVTNATSTTFVGTANQVSVNSTGSTVTTSLVANPVIPGTAGLVLPIGTTAQRVSAVGSTRFNSTLGVFEGWNGSSWVLLGHGGPGVQGQSIITNLPGSSGTTIMVADATTPTILEGSQVGSMTITPTSTASRILVQLAGIIDSSQANRAIVVAIFRGTTCIVSTTAYIKNADASQAINVLFIDSPASTSPLNYTVRCGSSAVGGSWYFARPMTAALGGTTTTGFRLTEIVS